MEFKIFNKKESLKEQGKITSKDVGFLEDAYEFLKHAVADESHCLGNYLSSKDVKQLKKLEEARIIRTVVADMITENVVSQNWCRVKHICGKAMTLHELITRCLSQGDLETAKKLSELYGKLYLEYLEVLGVDLSKDLEPKSSA